MKYKGDRMEEWRDIEGYEGLYQISSLGRVKSLRNNKTRKEKILKLKKNNNGYVLVNLYKNKVMKTYQVHWLVAKAFIENPNNYPCFNQKDDNKENNNISNLEWITYKDNCNYGTRNQRIINSKKEKCFYTREIYCLENNKIYNSIKQASEELNLDSSNIVKVLKGRLKQTKCYTFRYANKVL